MIQKLSLILAVLAPMLLGSSCTKSEEQNIGSIIISSQFNFDNASLVGYNFEKAKSVLYPTVEDVRADIIVDQFRLLNGNLKPGFTSPSNPYGFYLYSKHNSREESLDYFNKVLIEVDTTMNLQSTSDTVELYQLWVLKTANKNYVKIHIDDIQEVEDDFGMHLELMLDYHIQPNGTPYFGK